MALLEKMAGQGAGQSLESPDRGSTSTLPGDRLPDRPTRHRPRLERAGVLAPVAPPLTPPTAPSPEVPRRGGGPAGNTVVNPRYTFEAFVIGASNRFAHAAAQRVAETPAKSYNPLFIYGDSGLGKTHLLHAIGHYVIQNFPVLRVRYVSTETFMNDFVDAIRNNSQMTFKRRYRDGDVLLVDDIQFVEGKEGAPGGVFPHLQLVVRGLQADRACPRTGIPAPSPRWRTGCGAGSSGGSRRMSSPRSSRPASPSSGKRPKPDRVPVPRGRSRAHRHPRPGQHPGAGGCSHRGLGIRQPQPRTPDPGHGPAGPVRHPRRRPAPADHPSPVIEATLRRPSGSASRTSAVRAGGGPSSTPDKSVCTSSGNSPTSATRRSRGSSGGETTPPSSMRSRRWPGLMKERRLIYDQVTDLIHNIKGGG